MWVGVDGSTANSARTRLRQRMLQQAGFAGVQLALAGGVDQLTERGPLQCVWRAARELDAIDVGADGLQQVLQTPC